MRGGRRTKYLYEYQGKTWTRKQLAELSGLSVNVIGMRLLRNNNVVNERVLSSKKQSKNKHFINDYDGSRIAVSEFCNKYDLSYKAIRYRYEQGVRDPEILGKPSYCIQWGECQLQNINLKEN